jgi:membrane associated rhomboid family serine protease
MIRGGFSGIPPVVKNLLIINIAAFIISLFTKGMMQQFLGLYAVGSPLFEPYQVVSHMFMHGSFMHVFFNMFALWMFGTALERVWGPQKFFLFYVICGLGAALIHEGYLFYQMNNLEQTMLEFGVVPDEVQAAIMEGRGRAEIQFNQLVSRTGISFETLQDYYFLNVVPTVGASGAVMGILLGFGMLFPNTELMLIFFPVPIKAKYFVILYAILELVLGFSRIPGDNVAHFAHLGGMLFGFILIKIWQKDRRNFY